MSLFPRPSGQDGFEPLGLLGGQQFLGLVRHQDGKLFESS